MHRTHVDGRAVSHHAVRESPGDLLARIVPASASAHVRTAADLSDHIAIHGAVGHGTLPMPPAFGHLVPAGALERGRIYCCTGDAPLSLLFSLVAPATRQGSWFAMVDMPHAGLQAAREHGVALHRTVCASSGNPAAWPLVVGALLDGIDIVAVSSPTCRAPEVRRLAARVKASGAVLFITGGAGAFTPDVVLHGRTVSWNFDLHAHSRRVDVSASGRRVHGERTRLVHLPGVEGGVESTHECTTGGS